MLVPFVVRLLIGMSSTARPTPHHVHKCSDMYFPLANNVGACLWGLVPEPTTSISQSNKGRQPVRELLCAQADYSGGFSG
ncbi:hypothetical protein V8F06_003664 [Rhypophila decipiens]